MKRKVVQRSAHQRAARNHSAIDDAAVEPGNNGVRHNTHRIVAVRIDGQAIGKIGLEIHECRFLFLPGNLKQEPGVGTDILGNRRQIGRLQPPATVLSPAPGYLPPERFQLKRIPEQTGKMQHGGVAVEQQAARILAHPEMCLQLLHAGNPLPRLSRQRFESPLQ